MRAPARGRTTTLTRTTPWAEIQADWDNPTRLSRRAAVPLYDGTAAASLADVAPYLVRPVPDGAAADWLDGSPRLAGATLFLTSDEEIGRVRAHPRRLTRVRTEDGAVLLFRFYDPLVLRGFLPTRDAAQAAVFFGPVES